MLKACQGLLLSTYPYLFITSMNQQTKFLMFYFPVLLFAICDLICSSKSTCLPLNPAEMRILTHYRGDFFSVQANHQ